MIRNGKPGPQQIGDERRRQQQADAQHDDFFARQHRRVCVHRTSVGEHHFAEHSRGLPQIVGPENNPADEDCEQGICMSEECGNLLQHSGESEALQDQERPVIGAPYEKGPRGAVPKSAKKEDDDEISVGVEGTVTVAAERNVEIVAEPT